MDITKSFRYNPTEEPEVHKWIEGLKHDGRDFSKSIRNLIKNRIENFEVVPVNRNSPIDKK